MFDDFPKGPHRVPFDGSFKLKDASSAPPKGAPTKRKECEEILAGVVEKIAEHQQRLYASDDHSILMIFQAIDAAGKDGTIRAVMTGINPAGCKVTSFKVPSAEELDHDFFWRASKALPGRGEIGIFNRSYYEEVLVVRVHPEYLQDERLPGLPKKPSKKDLEALWAERYESIRDWEKHLARNGTVILKFWLNVGRDEQKKRFLERIDEPHKNWKFSAGDIKERARWDDYMAAFEDALRETSRPWAPWYAIPADDKDYMRVAVAQVLEQTMKAMGLDFPELGPDDRAKLAEMRKLLEEEGR